MRRSLYRPKAREKRVFDEGTPNEQTVTMPYKLTYLDIALARVGWWLSEHMGVQENLPRKFDGGYGYPDGLHSGTGFFMSQPSAGRIYWVWRGHTKWSIFFGRRKKPRYEASIIEFERYK